MKHTIRVAPFPIFLALLSLIPAAMAQSPAASPSHRRAHVPSTRAAQKAHPDAGGSVFGTAQGYPAGFGGATQSVAGDLNGDGVPDLAIVNPCNSSYCGAGYGSLAILLGNGDGTFQNPVLYATGTYQPMSVAIGDFNQDGALDLVVASQCPSSANCGTGQVSVLLGNGDGTFQSPIPYSAGAGSSYFVAVGDFNKDGNLDLAVANQTSASSTINILLGNGDGTFQAPVSYSTGTGSASFVAVGDFNNDGAPDLAVANAGTDSVSILLGNGDGTFQSSAIYASGGAFAYSVAVGDLNGDGIPDLAVANGCATFSSLTCSSAGSVGVLLGNGDGTFQPPVSYGSGGNQASSVAIADFDGDGILDLAVGNLGPATGGTAGVLSLLLGNGDGTFQPAVTFGTAASYASSVVASDFNGDGQPDIAVVNECPLSGGCSGALAGVLLNTAPGFNSYANSISLTSTVNPAGANQAVLLTAAVTPGFNAGTVTGNVTFYDGDTALATAAISSGQATYTASFSTPGQHPVQAVYEGDPNYAPGASAILREIVGTPVTLSSSLNPAAFPQQVTLTATVAGVGGTPTGSVTFMDGAVSLGTSPVASGSAAVTSSSLAAGMHHIAAAYSGDTNFAPGSAAITQAVSQSTTTVLASNSNSATVNQPVTFTATVTGQYGGVPTGAVAFMQGSPATTWGTAPLVNGQATVLNQFTTQNTYPITAVYLGGANYQSGASAVLNQVVSGNQTVTTTTGLTTSGTPSAVNQPVTFTATVSPTSGSIPNGETVTFFNGANTLGTALTANGAAGYITSSLPVGTNSITATYAGDGTYQSSTSHVVKQVVQLNATNTTLTSSLNPSTYGQSLTFTVTVAPQTGSGTPTGSVTLKNGANPLVVVPLSNGTGSYSTSTLPAGPLAISASYPGDANFANSSAALTQTVNVATTTTTLSATPNPSSLNQTVTFTATVTGQYGGIPGGTVTFTQGSNNLGAAAPIHGKAVITTSFPTAGSFPVIATYSGDVSDTGSVSAAWSQVVGNVTTTTTLTSSASQALAGQLVTFTATVTPSSGAIPNGETVTFYDGAAVIGTGNTTGGVVAFGTSALATGSHSITAVYPGDSTYQTSTSKVLIQVVKLNGSSTTLQSSVNPSTYGQSLTLSATVAPASGSATPTGKVTFKNGSAVLASVTMTNGSAAFTTSTLPAGSLALSASYSGDTNFSNSSGGLTQIVNQSTTVVTVTSNPNPSSLSQSVTFTATVTGQYSGAIITGSVSFMNGSKSMGSAPLNTRGVATFTNAFSTSGTDSITAVYTGDSNNQGGSSPVLSQVVTNATTTTTLSAGAGDSAFVGQPVTFTATVSSGYGAIPDGELVTFYDSSNSIGTGTTKGGAASLTTSSLTVGLHFMTATYAGDGSFLSSTSKQFKESISQQSTTTVVTSSADPSVYGGAVTFTASVTAAGPVPTGTVRFMNGASTLGTAALNSSGTTTFTTVTLGAGSYAITAQYNGDTNSAKSVSAGVNQVVNQAATTTQLVSSINPASVAESINFTAIVRSPTTFATGTVTFTAGSQLIGTGTLVNGTAKLAVVTLPAGATNITATYAPSANVAGSSATMVQYVE
jgi:hypothetical protein